MTPAFVRDGRVDLVNNFTVLFAGAGPVVRTADGQWIDDFQVESVSGTTAKGHLVAGEQRWPTTAAWSVGGEDGLDVRVRVDGAPADAAVGVRMGMPRAHLGGGVDLLTTEGPRTVGAEAGEPVAGIRKLLAGAPRAEENRPVTLVSVSPADAQTPGQAVLRDATDPALLDVALLTVGVSASLHFVTDPRPLAAEARERLTEAQDLLRTDPGQGITALKAFATEYPFQEGMRERALQAAAKREAEAWKDVDGLREALRVFRIFRSQESLADLEKRANKLGQEFPAGKAGGALSQQVAELRAEADIARRDYLRRGAGRDLTRLSRAAQMLSGEDGYQPMAAMFYEIVVRKLTPLAGDPSFQARLDEAQGALKKLKSKYADSIPPLPSERP